MTRHATSPDPDAPPRARRRVPGWRDFAIAVLVLAVIAMAIIYVLGRQRVDDSTRQNFEQQLVIDKQNAVLSTTCLQGPLSERYHRQPLRVQTLDPNGDERDVELYVCVSDADIPRPPQLPPGAGAPPPR